jgi:hypothetical protein
MKAWLHGKRLFCLLLLAPAASGQQQIGSVGLQDATVAGPLEVSNGRAVLMGASTITARDHTAEVTLQRGGVVRVCSTSGLHLTAGKGAGETPLMMALDRGAIEIASHVSTSDMVMTPDLRFTMKSPGSLDLRLRVARNGDTCVENRGDAAPELTVTDQFGESTYVVKTGQHVLFEHGSLKEVVDHESEPCGCPPVPVVSVADAGVSGATAAKPGDAVAANTVEAQHPFPAAQSAGMAPVTGPPQAPPGQVHAQVSTTLIYGGDPAVAGAGDGSAGSSATSGPVPASPKTSQGTASASEITPATSAAAATPTVKAEAPPPPPAPPPGDVFHSIGRFFKKLFGGH